MPRRTDIETICLVGSGPIVIGQAAEFDYAGCQALKVLREDGFRTIVVNSNPATIMTDPGFADRTYLEPLDLEGVADVLRRERPDALLPTMGGQTALNLARELARVRDPRRARHRADRRAARRHPARRGQAALQGRGRERAGCASRRRAIVTDIEPARRVATARGRPAGVHARRPRRRLRVDARRAARQVEIGLRESPIGQVLVEESVRGWDEFELEVVRDRLDNVVIVCSIENLDPMGVHTGDSVTVAPQMTLPDEAYQELRDAAAAVMRAVGVDTGGSNIQFARSRETGEVRVIEMNPRVSRSSALASKATGYPIAKVAAKLAVGYTLDEIPNDLTGTTPASFEPTLDYVVVKFPRFAFEKFPGADRTLGTQMKSVGETMGIGRTFAEAFLKAMRSRELDAGAATPWQTLADVPDDVHPFFVEEIWRIQEALLDVAGADVDAVRRRRLAAAEAARPLRRRHRRGRRRARGRRARAPARLRRASRLPARRLVRRRGRGGVELLLLDLGRGGRGARRRARSRASSSSAPARTASARAIEFDYCCVHAVADVPRARLRGGDGQLQPGDGLDRLRHLRPPLLRAARRRVGARRSATASGRRASSSSSAARRR